MNRCSSRPERASGFPPYRLTPGRPRSCHNRRCGRGRRSGDRQEGRPATRARALLACFFINAGHGCRDAAPCPPTRLIGPLPGCQTESSHRCSTRPPGANRISRRTRPAPCRLLPLSAGALPASEEPRLNGHREPKMEMRHLPFRRAVERPPSRNGPDPEPPRAVRRNRHERQPAAVRRDEPFRRCRVETWCRPEDRLRSSQSIAPLRRPAARAPQVATCHEREPHESRRRRGGCHPTGVACGRRRGRGRLVLRPVVTPSLIHVSSRSTSRARCQRASGSFARQVVTRRYERGRGERKQKASGAGWRLRIAAISAACDSAGRRAGP